MEAQPSSIVFTGTGTLAAGAGVSFETAAGQQFQMMNVVSQAEAPVDWTASVVAISGGNWLSASPTSGVTPTSLILHSNTGSLPPGTYESQLIIRYAGGTKALTVPVFLKLTPSAGSVFQVSPSRLSFVVRAGGASASQFIVVSDVGSTLLNWNARTQALLSSSAPWLSVSPTAGTTPSSATVTVDPSSLSEGSYSDSIEVSSGTTSLSVPVSVSVLPPLPAAILLDPQTFVVDYVQGEASPEPSVLNISTRGSNSFSWQATANSGSDNPSWLSVSLTEGLGPTGVRLLINPSALSPGQYRATVDVSLLGSSTGRSSWVTLNVYPAGTGTMNVTPASLSLHASANSSAAVTQSLRIASSLGFANWTAKVLSSTAKWLSLSTGSGTTPGSVDVSADPAGLVPGVYTAAVEMSASGFTNSPQLVPVALVIHPVNAKPAITADKGSLLFVSTSPAALPPAQTVTVKAEPEGNLQWTAIPTTATGQPWLLLDRTAGTTPDTISVSLNSSILSPGKYVGAISLLSAGADNWSVSIPVIVVVDDANTATPATSPGEISLLHLPGNFQAPVGVSLPVQVVIRNSEGRNVSGGRVNVRFSTGESVDLTETETALYSGRWTPAASGPVGIQILASKGSYTASFGTSGTIVSLGADPTFIFNGGVVNAAFSLPASAPVAPGSLLSVFGTKLLGTAQQSLALPLPTALGGVKIYFNELEARFIYGSPGQFNIQVPYELEGRDRAVMRLERNGMVAVTQDVRLARSAPAVFTQPGTTDAAVLHASDGTLVSSTKPAKRGEYLSIFVTGLGPTKTRIPTGNAASGDLFHTEETPQVLIGGVPAAVSFSGLAPGFVGLYQINVQLPPTVYSGLAVPLVIRLGNLASDAATIAVE